MKVVHTLSPFSADTSLWLVETKLHPPLLRRDTIRRPRLEEALCRAVSTEALTLLSAPAGYGKTTALAALPRLLPDLPLAWVTLDSEDNDPIRFLGLVTAAIQRLRPECGRSVWPQLSGGADGTALKRSVGALINDIAGLPAPLLLVLDDLHLVTEPAIYVALEYLLDHLPAQLRLAVGTRHDPPLRLARLAARRQLAELRRPDLGFSRDESDRLLNQVLELGLGPDEVAVLQERTEGWPAGLCLLAGSIRRAESAAGRTQFLAAVADRERYAMEFLADETLRALPDDLYRFLLRTSVLPEMTPTLCRAVTGREDAGEVLDRLYRQNLTIASIGSEAAGEPVYRHHALFSRLLLRELERELPEEMTELHRRAARAQRRPGRAIVHYLSAGLWEEAAQLIAQTGMQLLHRGMAETVRNWYGALPPAVRAGHPHLVVIMARCEIHRGDYAAAERLLTQAREAFVASGDEAGEADAITSLITLTMQSGDRTATAARLERAQKLPLQPMGQVASLLARAWLHLAEGRWAASRSDIEAALAIPGSSGNRQADLVGITYMSAAPLVAVPGCLDAVQAYCAEAMALAPPNTAWRVGAAELAVWPLLLRGRFDEALAGAESAEGMRQNLGGYPFVGNDLPVLLAVLRLHSGDPEGAGRAAETLLQRLERAPRCKLGFYLHAAGRTFALLRRMEEAKGLCRRLSALEDGLDLTAYLRDHLTGLIALVEGRPKEAFGPLERAADMEPNLPIARGCGSARLLRARALNEQGPSDVAQKAVSSVLQEWAEAGTPGAALLDGQAAMTATRQVAPSRAREAAPSLPEPLTPREEEVLRLVVAGRTNRQIGQELFISEETVKSHVVHILRKMDVTSRTQAAIRGREMGF